MKLFLTLCLVLSSSLWSLSFPETPTSLWMQASLRYEDGPGEHVDTDLSQVVAQNTLFALEALLPDTGFSRDIPLLQQRRNGAIWRQPQSLYDILVLNTLIDRTQHALRQARNMQSLDGGPLEAHLTGEQKEEFSLLALLDTAIQNPTEEHLKTLHSAWKLYFPSFLYNWSLTYDLREKVFEELNTSSS